MAKKRKQYSNEFKFKVALEAIKGVKPCQKAGGVAHQTAKTARQ